MIKPTLYILLALSLAACAGGDCEPQAVVSPAADVVTASPATPVTGTSDRACKDANGKDVACAE
jgi:hypothetical protein